jgi:hypothetical protein
MVMEGAKIALLGVFLALCRQAIIYARYVVKKMGIIMQEVYAVIRISMSFPYNLFVVDHAVRQLLAAWRVK